MNIRGDADIAPRTGKVLSGSAHYHLPSPPPPPSSSSPSPPSLSLSSLTLPPPPVVQIHSAHLTLGLCFTNSPHLECIFCSIKSFFLTYKHAQIILILLNLPSHLHLPLSSYILSQRYFQPNLIGHFHCLLF